MVLITQPNSLPTSGLEKYSLILLVAHAEEAISAETVKALFDCGTEVSVHVLTKQADDMELAFSIGALAGENGGMDNVMISLNSATAKEMLKRMGMEKALYSPQKRASTKRKSAAKPAASDITKDEIKKTRAKKSVENHTEKKDSVRSQTNEKKEGKNKSVRFSAAFMKILKSCAVDTAYADGIAKAVRESAESISYELRLQLNLMNREVSADIYAKTKDRYDELKALV